MTTVPATDLCLPIDTSYCQTEWDAFEPEVQARATAYAQMTYSMLTGYRLGGCPVTVRPCRESCVPPTYLDYPVRGGSGVSGRGPFTMGGRWFNAVCGCGVSGCSCTRTCDLRLPGEVATVDEVSLDGIIVDPTLYRLDGPNLLVSLGECWPLCQNMAAEVDEEGSFTVTYTPGPAADGLDAFAIGLLACEYGKATQGQRCRLPAGVTSVARQGVTLDLATSPFPGGLTGIPEVDSRIKWWNPHGLVTPSTVWSPDLRSPRRPRP